MWWATPKISQHIRQQVRGKKKANWRQNRGASMSRKKEVILQPHLVYICREHVHICDNSEETNRNLKYRNK
jgi:hypothetical protein